MKLVFATNNINKLSEINQLFPDKIEIMSLCDINCFEDIPETNPTLEENALQKAQFVYKHYGFDCFADDTGLEIYALGGEPGVYSARYAGEECSAEKNIQKVISRLEGISDRRAKFRTIITLIIKGKIFYFEGVVEGKITKSLLGLEGFGYDPIFMPNGFDKTFAQMNKIEKGEISHRAIAVNKLVDFCLKM